MQKIKKDRKPNSEFPVEEFVEQVALGHSIFLGGDKADPIKYLFGETRPGFQYGGQAEVTTKNGTKCIYSVNFKFSHKQYLIGNVDVRQLQCK